MKLIKEIRDNAAILTLKGEFDSFVCTPFVEQIKLLYESNIKYLIVDLRLVLFINSTAIGTLVKIHKEAKSKGGQLVLCRPSHFVNSVLDSLGLLELFKIAEDPDAALKALGASNDGMDMSGENSVMMKFAGSKETCVAKLTALEEGCMGLKVADPKGDLTEGTVWDVKFRLPLFRKGHYFEASVKIINAMQEKDGLQLNCSFEEIKDDDRKSIGQFVNEMKFLRSEARKDK
ncbi:MAG: anti-sigma factor antagonist [Planctomycetota bacterium]